MKDGWRRFWTLPILFYQRFLSPLKPPTCRFHPTCSAFGVQALMTHGVAKGLLLTTWRILRCQPFAKGGSDPVPELGHWRPTPLESSAREDPGGG